MQVVLLSATPAFCPKSAHREVGTINSLTAHAKGAIGSLDLDGPLAL